MDEIQAQMWCTREKHWPTLPSQGTCQWKVQEPWRHEYWPKDCGGQKSDCTSHRHENGLRAAGEGFGGAKGLVGCGRQEIPVRPSQSPIQEAAVAETFGQWLTFQTCTCAHVLGFKFHPRNHPSSISNWREQLGT